jgi:hypothetical protein
MRDFIVRGVELSLLVKAKCCYWTAVRDAVALLDLRDFENCGVASVWDSDPGDDLRVNAIGQGVGKLDKLADEMVDGHRFELVRITYRLG